MFRRFIPWILGLSALACILGGCKKEADKTKIEDVAVQDIPVSEPPKVEIPKPQEPSWNYDGIWKVEKGLTYYNAVVPLGATLISTNEMETRFYVKNMNSREAKQFIAKYFPYQNLKYFPAVDLIELYKTRNPEYEDGSVVIDLDPNIIKPEPGHEVAITVYWSSNNKWYEWVYHDPSYQEPEPEPNPPDDVFEGEENSDSENVAVFDTNELE